MRPDSTWVFYARVVRADCWLNSFVWAAPVSALSRRLDQMRDRTTCTAIQDSLLLCKYLAWTAKHQTAAVNTSVWLTSYCAVYTNACQQYALYNISNIHMLLFSPVLFCYLYTIIDSFIFLITFYLYSLLLLHIFNLLSFYVLLSFFVNIFCFLLNIYFRFKITNKSPWNWQFFFYGIFNFFK